MEGWMEGAQDGALSSAGNGRKTTSTFLSAGDYKIANSIHTCVVSRMLLMHTYSPPTSTLKNRLNESKGEYKTE